MQTSILHRIAYTHLDERNVYPLGLEISFPQIFHNLFSHYYEKMENPSEIIVFMGI